MPGLLAAKPPLVDGGLLQPVIWDRLRDTRALGPLALQGGGGGAAPRAPVTEPRLPLRGGKTHSKNVRHSAPEKPMEEPYKPEFKWHVTGGTGGHGRAVLLPQSKIALEASPYHSRMLTTRGRMARTPRERGPLDGARITFRHLGVGDPSTSRGIRHFEEVHRAVRDYVRAFKPRQIVFAPGSDKHRLIYDRVAPLVARDLGGRLGVEKGPEGLSRWYTITIPKPRGAR